MIEIHFNPFFDFFYELLIFMTIICFDIKIEGTLKVCVYDDGIRKAQNSKCDNQDFLLQDMEARYCTQSGVRNCDIRESMETSIVAL